MVRYAVQIATALTADPRVELHVLAAAGARGLWVVAGVQPGNVHPVPRLSTPLLSAAERSGIALRVAGRDFDVVHGVKHLLPVRSSAVRLLTVHDMLPLDRPRDFGVVKRTLLTRPYLASIREADRIVTVSSATLTRMAAYVPAARAKARVVPLATSTSLRSAHPVPVGSLRGRRFAMVVGDASPRKNLRTLVTAWSSYVARGGDVPLVIIGPPGWGTNDRGGAAFEALSAAGLVLTLGQIPDDQLAWCYRHTDLVLCPSLLEGFGLPALEALTFSAPVVTSDDQAMCEVTGPDVLHVGAHDVAEWVSAITRLLGTRRSPSAGAASEATRTWADVGRETVDHAITYETG